MLGCTGVIIERRLKEGIVVTVVGGKRLRRWCLYISLGGKPLVLYHAVISHKNITFLELSQLCIRSRSVLGGYKGQVRALDEP